MSSPSFLTASSSPKLFLSFRKPVIVGEYYLKLKSLFHYVDLNKIDELQSVKAFLKEIQIPLKSVLTFDPLLVPVHVETVSKVVVESKDKTSKPRNLFATHLNLNQKRTLFTFYNKWKSNELRDAFDQADSHPNDARAQADLYSLLIARDPDTIIGRFEDSKYARDEECVVYYVTALQVTNQLERASRFMLDPGKKLVNAVKEDAQRETGRPQPGFGTKESPVYVKNLSEGKSWGKRFNTLLNFVIGGAILYSLANMADQRLGGITTRVHKMFHKHKHEGQHHTFDDVQGCDEAKAELQEIVDFLKNPSKYSKLGARMPKGVLLVGPPGTGKTLLAKAMAGEADVPFIYASGSEFDEMFVGIGSMRIRQMFESAKQQSPAIIFIDEIDAVGSRRSMRDPQHSRMSLNQLLTELDGFSENQGIVVIAATNFPESLDPALLRPGRFDKHVEVPLPDVRGRRQILDMYLGDVRLSTEIDTQVIARATPGFSGADLFKMINQAKIMASLESVSVITQRHLERSKDEMIMGVERKSAVIADEDRKLTAYHESGHAIVAMHTPMAHPIHKATIIPRGRALGMVSQVPEKDELSLSKTQLLARMDVAMGGRIAEELIFGGEHVTTGASSDFTAATRIARAMVTQYGMSESLGTMVVSEEDWETLSPTTKHSIEAEIKTILEASRCRAMSIIQRHRHELERLAKALLEYETLTREEIVGIIKAAART